MQKFPGQGSNPHHSSDPGCFSDNVGSLTHCATREHQKTFTFGTCWVYKPIFSIICFMKAKYRWGVSFLFFFFKNVFWLCPCHVQVPGPGIKHLPQQWPELLQWQYQILNPLHHQGNSTNSFIEINSHIIKLTCVKCVTQCFLVICRVGQLSPTILEHFYHPLPKKPCTH